MELSGLVTVITGGASGLGEATARLLLARGGRVALLDVARPRGEKLAAELLAKGLCFAKTDVTSDESVQAALKKTIETFGAVHVAVNCAGVGTPAKVIGKEGPMSLEFFKTVVNINLVGTLNVTRLAAARMLGERAQ